MKQRKIWSRLTGAGLLIGGLIGLHKHRDAIAAEHTPDDFSWKSWRRSLFATKKAMGDKNIGMLSAGIAYFGVLGFFPLVAACVALAGLVIQPDKLQAATATIGQFVPADIHTLLATQLENAAGRPTSNAFVAVAGIMLSIVAAAGAIGNMMNALNVVYQRKEVRNFVQQRATSIVLTIGLIMVMVVIVPLVFAGGDVLLWLGLPTVLIDTFSYVRWLLLAVIMMLSLAILYHFGPSPAQTARWSWLSWGAIIATNLWMLASGMFFIYLQYFANFSDSYSLFAGLIALMIWLNLTSFIVLLGGEINHRLERRNGQA